MIKKDVTYENLDGVQVTKTFFFNLSKAELAEMALTSDGGGGLADEIRAIQETPDINLILKSFRNILSAAVGVRVGDRFIKNDEVRSELMDTEAYGELFMELVTDASKAVEFIKGVIPNNVKDIVNKKIAHDGLTIEGWDVPERKVETVAPVEAYIEQAGKDAGVPEAEIKLAKDISQYTRADLMEMSEDAFYDLVGTDSRKWNKAVLSIAMARRAANKE